MRSYRKASEREDLVKAYGESGMSEAEFCEQHKVAVNTFRKYLRSSFEEVRIQQPLTRATEVIVTFPDGTVLRLR